VDGSYERAAWFNTVVRNLWPHVDAAVASKVHAAARAALASGLGGGFAIELTHFSLGAQPLTLCGVRAYGDPAAVDQTNSVVFDLDVRLASTEPNVVARVSSPLLPGPLTLQLAALQLRAVVRVSLRMLSARLPPFEALTVRRVGVLDARCS